LSHGNYAVPVAAAKKKASKTVSTAARKPRLTREEGERRLVDATIDLLLTTPPDAVTVALISKKAGVHHDYVARYFGSREELLVQAVESATLRTLVEANLTNSEQRQQALLTISEQVRLSALRGRLITYLLACGVSPRRFQPTQQLLMTRAQEASANPNLTNRTTRNLVLAGTMIIQAMNVMGEVNSMSDQEMADILGFIANLRPLAEQIQKANGWDKPRSSTKKK